MTFSSVHFVWKNGKIVPWGEATVHLSSHGLHYGSGVFEGVRCYDTPRGPAVFRLGSHIDRWLLSAQVYGLSWRYSRHDLAHAILELIRANRFRACYIRPIAFFGSHTLRLHPQGCPVEVSILAWPLDDSTGPESDLTGIDVCISPWKKFSPQAIPARGKACGQQLNSVLAMRDASLRGFSEGLLLDDAGCLTEASGANLFVVQKNRLLTNDLDSGALLGITRDSVVHLAGDLDIAVFVQKMRLETLFDADEAFLTSTTCGIMPVLTVDMNPIGSGTRGPLTARLQDAYHKMVSGRSVRYEDWLTYVRAH